MIVYCQILFSLGMSQLKYFLVLQPLLQPVAVSGIAFRLDMFSVAGCRSLHQWYSWAFWALS